MQRAKIAEGWQNVYREKPESELSWHEPHPTHSLDMIRRYAPSTESRIVDVGAGTSRLVDSLLEVGSANVTVLDVSQEALIRTASRLDSQAGLVRFLKANILDADSIGEFELWHDRALFHFLTATVEPRELSPPSGTSTLITSAPRSAISM